MDERDVPPTTFEDPTLLFEEYLEAREAGREVDPEELARRAGDRAAELRRRITVFRSLEDLSEMCASGPEDAALETAAPPEPDLCELGRFRNLLLIGAGGLSRVFVADDPKLGRRVALKVLNAAHVATRDARAWMKNEGQSLAQLEHPNVLKVFELDEADGQAYIATEYLAGPSLQVVLERMRARARGEACAPDPRAWVVDALARDLEPIAVRARLLRMLADALAHCHAKGVIHRDFKPANVILQPGPTPKLIDFGLAHLESQAGSRIDITQSLMGTPAYLSPEQIDNGRTGASPQSDQFALGVVLYEILTLENPFQRKTRHEIVDAVSRAVPIAPSRRNGSIPIDLERICLHALERLPSARYPSLAALAADLVAFDEHRSISLVPPTPWKLAWLWARRHRRDVALAGSVAALAVLAIGISFGVEAAQDRADLQVEVDRIVAGLADASTTDQFSSAYVAAHALEEEGRSLDGTVAGRWFSPSARDLAHAAMRATSQYLKAHLADEFARVGDLTGFLRVGAERDLMLLWAQVLGMDASYCPDCPYNEETRQRGSIEVLSSDPEASVRVQRHVPINLPGAIELIPIECAVDLRPGAYRAELTSPNGGLLAEVDFVLDPAEKRRSLVLSSVQPVDLEAMRRIEEQSLSLPGGTQLRVPSFRCSPLVTWTQIEAQPPSTDPTSSRAYWEKRLDRPNGAVDSPATVPYGIALRYAASRGMRLPTLLEWFALASIDQGIGSRADAGLQGELVTGRQPDGDLIFAWYGRPLSIDRIGEIIGNYRPDALALPKPGERRGLGFRLIISAP